MSLPFEEAVVVGLAEVGFAVVGFEVVAPPEDPEEAPEHSPLEIKFLIQGRKPWTRT